MRIALRGGSEEDHGRLAALLRGAGCEIVAEHGCDLRLTLDAARPDGLLLDPLHGTARLDGRGLRLSRIEFALLSLLVRRGSAVGRAELLAEVWGHRHDPGSNLLAVHVSRLRGKVGRDRIVRSGDGYRFA